LATGEGCGILSAQQDNRESKTMTIGRLIQGRDAAILTCTADTPVSDAVAILADRRIGALPVKDGTALAGMFSERDVIYGLRQHGPSVLSMTVGEVMTAPAVTVEPETTVLQALSLMTRRRIRHLPVVVAGEMAGFVSGACPLSLS
jgi:CBS domain-containing protein